MPTERVTSSPEPKASARPPRAAVGASQPRRLDLAAVNGWRGPGALAIAAAHFGVATDFFSYRHLEPVAPLVDLFFVLSGLVIAQAYTAKLARASAIPEYVVRRFGRIWPVQAATLLLLVGYELSQLIVARTTGDHFSSAPFSPEGNDLVQAIPTNLLLIQSLGVHDRETWNFPSWSLSVEFVTYVGFAVVCLVRPAWRIALSLTTIVASLAILGVLSPYGMRSTYDYGIFRCLAGFFAGTLCYELATRFRMPAWRYPTAVELLVVGLTIAWLVTSERLYAAFAAPLVFGLFVLAFIDGKGLLSRLLASRPFQVFAEWSFSIYMVHALVLLALLVTLHAVARRFHVVLFTHIANPLATLPGARAAIEVIHIDSPALRSVIAIVYLAGVLAASLVVLRFVEIPGRNAFAKLGKAISKMPPRGARINPEINLERAS